MQKQNVGVDGVGSSEEVCPFSKTPDPECYCHEMNGRKVNLAVRFCLNDYKSCRIYRRRFLKEAGAADETDSVK